jgi:hypothetical protein
VTIKRSPKVVAPIGRNAGYQPMLLYGNAALRIVRGEAAESFAADVRGRKLK